MTDHFETLSYVISNLFRIYAMYLFSNAYFRGQGKVKYGVTLALFFGYFIVNSVGNLIYPSTFINMLTNVVPYFLLTFLYRGSFLKKVIAVFISYAVSLCIDAFLVSIEYIMDDKNIIISSGIATSFLIFLAERVYEYCVDKKEIYPELRRKQLLLIMTIPIGSIVIAAQTMQNRDYNYLLESSILFLINAIVFYMYDSLLKTGNEKYKTAVLEEQNHSYANQLKVYQEAVQKDKIVRHDMKNHLHQIRDFVERERIMELKQYTESMLATMENDSVVCNTGNQEIDSILNFKCARWNQLNVEVHFDLNVPPELNIESFDLTKILGNLLDNVSDAIEKVEKRIVYIRIHYEKGIVNICIRNTFNGQIAVADGNLMTMKANSQKHGFGYQSIKEAVEKYNGEVEFDYTDKVFSVYVILYEK
ncbi:sensor histidine kinase [uncultured Ruminococcus sp.]|uniref:sensor histidine kinase n=1 Tax=uncultured Ruminococcus sp. TaxID=165186 RepID=UPI0025D5DC86|nr:sensor histidine kinase [uncultured Ruminococcus sp.]